MGVLKQSNKKYNNHLSSKPIGGSMIRCNLFSTKLIWEITAWGVVKLIMTLITVRTCT